MLDGFLLEQTRRAEEIGPRYSTLWERLRRNASGGKRLRPVLVLAAYEAFGGTDLDTAARVGAAFELLHTALILHDDVIDRDFVRRGTPNLSGEYRDIAHTAGIPLPHAEHRGASAAVIAGDLALTAALTIVPRDRMSPETYDRIQGVLDDAVFRSAAGELLDIEYTLGPDIPSIDDVLHMERLKTAVYSFEAPLRAGAVLAGAQKEALSALEGFGHNIGVAYQIVDDLLGVYGDEKQTGKSIIGDLREGKRTVLIAYAATTPGWAAIAPFIGREDLSESQAAWLRQALENAGARGFAEALARQCANTAWSYLASPALPDTVRDEFKSIVVDVLERVR